MPPMAAGARARPESRALPNPAQRGAVARRSTPCTWASRRSRRSQPAGLAGPVVVVPDPVGRLLLLMPR
eukprot:5913423-Heterocapsa_arctica.AAC.1